MQIPLLDTRSGPRAEAESELLRLQGRLDGRRAELGQQVLLAWKSLELARGRTEALSQGAVREAEAALRVAQAAYRYGERGILDVLDAQRVLRSVRADLLDARYQQQVARIELELLAGRHGDPTALRPHTPFHETDHEHLQAPSPAPGHPGTGPVVRLHAERLRPCRQSGLGHPGRRSPGHRPAGSAGQARDGGPVPGAETGPGRTGAHARCGGSHRGQ